MSTYLLTWNPKKWSWNNYSENQIVVESGQPFEIRWSCGVRKHMPVNSRVFLMLLGSEQPIQGIIASGYTLKVPFSAPHWDALAVEPNAQYVIFRFDELLNLDVHTLLNPMTEVSADFNWRPQSSGVEIPEEIAEGLELKWQEHLGRLGLNPVSEDSVRKDAEKHYEGKLSKVTVNRYERNPDARDECIKAHKPVCAVCAFDFVAKYGELGRNFIHVHHLNPIAMQGQEYEIDPKKDLIPVCPNCHAMLHRETPPLAIEQLKILIEQQQNLRG